jgi:hypothetical protein
VKRNRTIHSVCYFRRIVLPTLFLRAMAGVFLAGIVNASDVDFRRDVLPILSGKCFHCHGPDDAARQAGLRLDMADSVFRTEHPIVLPGDSSGSELIRRIIDQDPDIQMPPPATSNKGLTAAEIAILRQWIDQGAVWESHWAYESVIRPALPVVSTPEWPRNPIDHFVLSRLDQEGLQPSPESCKETLLRRVSYDLTGLPPAPDEIRDFLSDASGEAYEKAVDRLLASPHFGERWARHWLDAARYADSTGFETDAPKPMWKYRDWVIQAFNDDMKFDQFMLRQLAGDLLPNASADDRIATGFLLCGPQDGGSEPARLDAVIDRTNTVGTVLLGLTLGCAQCHSHKFDAISQEEYYRLFAFINSADEQMMEFASPAELAERDALRSRIAALISDRATYATQRGLTDVATDSGYQEKSKTIAEHESRLPRFDMTSVIAAAAPTRTTTLFVRGEFSQPGEPVTPGVPAILHPMPAGPPTRLELAHWLASSQNPLTPRVTVNRIWQQFFGRGLVETENDFGTQGTPPSHPELLDWLAAELIELRWRLKPLMRLIVTSTTYRQSSDRRDALEQLDPENRLLARQSRIRLDAEAIRDSALAVSGLLSRKLGGSSVFPFQHDGIMVNRATAAPWIMSEGEDRYRRTMYTHYWRLTPHPLLQTFDAPDSLTSCTRRRPTNTPLQALTLLNDPIFIECAEAMADKICKDSSDTSTCIRQLFFTCLGRAPDVEELEILMRVKSEAHARFNASNATGLSIDSVVWTQVVRVLLNSDEFITRE